MKASALASLVALLVIAVFGCDDARDLPVNGGPGGSAGSAVIPIGGHGGDGTTNLGGAGGHGGADMSDPYPSTFTRSDHDRCVNWPICPPGILSPADPALLRVSPNACRATFNIKITCGACIDTRTPECKPFIGTCMALNWPQSPVAYCGDLVPSPMVPQDEFTICTGPANGSDGGAAAHLVCDDAP